MAADIGKWGNGPHYGPVLSQTELYLLRPELELHPILTGSDGSFHLVMNMQTGLMGGFNAGSAASDSEFVKKDEPATLPRVQQLYIISDLAPWCTTVHNDAGVTLENICRALFQQYTQEQVTEAEIQALPPRVHDHIQRTAAHRVANQAYAPTAPWGAYTPTSPAPNRFQRVDWLRDRMFLEGLRKDPDYVRGRLGFDAPNIFIMILTS
ncbi:hypothetical protein EV122DRAFT_206677 [Schizophyllum commune]|uniref:DUF6699 domain-containing protein n=1 Tax=Schizophyllum commune (strain H4-8 / FGSC 9210) TaxID=578458 RepID=D8PU65_SCHCM|nr:uncharacterized protein SCHCODRAFT_02604273 [Schizophyllum commune H4-8]KAI4524908.1 hypothetical protein K525DRAFT_192823 [Schizophyllum commune Loenen D]KAI5828237.1 hypothetical protein K523DRAFT_307606 [Schizophyllum commune Tattone D]KAI5899130.1 hypothetical protein SCHCODRAFT_02604273 [Schizophyllum commune H4-8]